MIEDDNPPSSLVLQYEQVECTWFTMFTPGTNRGVNKYHLVMCCGMTWPEMESLTNHSLGRHSNMQAVYDALKHTWKTLCHQCRFPVIL